MRNERLHDTAYQLTRKEILELGSICYKIGNSWCPVDMFYNDIRDYYPQQGLDQNQAYKDLWLIVNLLLEVRGYKKIVGKTIEELNRIQSILKNEDYEDEEDEE